MISNKQQQQQQQWKRKLRFLDEEDKETIFVPSKKRMCENSSLTPLLEEVVREEREDDDDDFDQPSPTPWMPLRELAEDILHNIIFTHDETNCHGRRIILKIKIASTKKISEVYLPQRFSSTITPTKVAKFNTTVKI
ncbi:uncharacterized protein LOC120350241 [Nilaparvata lugens]|uniref:uncharacterized protein LOC120350241 n=1 Tax=Nilaparvata lugens TaxID=108931 RepID=UPI00193CA74D|nr:uncharacterized protein LOC120350241 [Nilaparvata lugens]